jgi:hypothetical protein
MPTIWRTKRCRAADGLACVVALLVVTPAMADPSKAACVDASSEAQTLRDAHRLVEARDQLRVCAAGACPVVIQRDCATWLSEVEAALPTVVLSATSGAGEDLVHVKVTVDGRPFAAKLDGQAVVMDPGAHTFHFEGPDGTAVDREVLIKEGAKSQPISVVLGAIPPRQPLSGPAVPPAQGGSAVRTTGWIVGAAGVASLGFAATLGVVAIVDKNSAHCVDNVCDPGTSARIKNAALLSDVGWIGAGVLGATGAALLIFAPKEKATESHVNVGVVFGPYGANVIVGGALW